jgi:hypothetical protein
MAQVIFDGVAHTITLRDRAGNVVGTWPANNRTANSATLPFVPNGAHTVVDTHTPHRHSATQDSANGAYGSHGIIRFEVPGHEGVGVHSGRENTPDGTPEAGRGTDHVTNGCIRTTDEAMQAITDTMANDQLSQIVVQHNQDQRPNRNRPAPHLRVPLLHRRRHHD